MGREGHDIREILMFKHFSTPEVSEALRERCIARTLPLRKHPVGVISGLRFS